ncbi:MAG: DUF5615 family PIN-like protein [Acidobacteria bacterium]|nr:DUF5615 family PIN-like protein [Acidobacteriota bacterium]
MTNSPLKLVLDLNLSPHWVDLLVEHGHQAVHWTSVGDPKASDPVLLEWARGHGYIVFTHDLDFSRLLALSHAAGPSVLQVRTQDVLPSAIGTLVLETLRQHAEVLAAGAIVVLDAEDSRARILPI